MKKSYLILIIIFVLLIGVYVVFFSGLINFQQDIKKLPLPTKDEINSITIKYGINGDPLKLTKENEDWMLQYREQSPIKGKAEKSSVDNILDKLEKIQIEGKDEGDYIDYGVDDSSGIFVDVMSDKLKTPVTFVIGTTNDNNKSTFIRLLDKKTVYIVSGDVRYPFKKNLNDFRNKSIFEYEPNNIEKIEYKAEDGKLVTFTKTVKKAEKTEKTDDKETEEPKDIIEWKNVETDKLLDVEGVESVIKQISKLNAVSFIDYPSQEELNKAPILELTYYENALSGKKYNLKVLREGKQEGDEKDRYVVKIDETTNPLYLISKYTIDNLMKIKEIKTLEEKEAEKAAEKEKKPNN